MFCALLQHCHAAASLFGEKAVRRPRVVKVTAGQSLVGRLAGQYPPHATEKTGRGGDIGDVARADDAGRYDGVVQRTAPVVGDAGQSDSNAHHRADVAHVAVGVPSAHVGDLDGTGEIAATVQQRQRDHCRVGNDGHYAQIAVVAPFALDVLTGGAPVVGMLRVPVHHCPHHPRVFAVGGNHRQSSFDQTLWIGFGEGRAHQGCYKACAVDPFAIVRYAGRLFRQVGGLFRSVGTD